MEFRRVLFRSWGCLSWMGQRSSNGAIISTRRALASKRLMLEEAGAECFDLQHALPPCFCLALRFFWRGAEGVDVGRAGRQPREGIANNRSEERRVGKGGVSTCRSRWWPDNQ